MKDKITDYVFSFECSVGWANLDLTDDEKIRFCGQCNKNVHFVDSQTELNQNAIRGNCVAFKKPDSQIPEPFEPTVLGGYILPPTELLCEICRKNMVSYGESVCEQCRNKKSWWQFWK